MSTSDLPWSALVGVAGILGTLAAVYLSNRSAERREFLRQQHEDKARFHKDRIELYGKFVSATRNHLNVAAEIVEWPTDDEDGGDATRGATATCSAAKDLHWQVQLVASAPVSVAAAELGIALQQGPVGDSDDGLDEYLFQVARALGDFLKAARAEILPGEVPFIADYDQRAAAHAQAQRDYHAGRSIELAKRGNLHEAKIAERRVARWGRLAKELKSG
jgi:hypothetical protein